MQAYKNYKKYQKSLIFPAFDISILFGEWEKCVKFLIFLCGLICPILSMGGEDSSTVLALQEGIGKNSSSKSHIVTEEEVFRRFGITKSELSVRGRWQYDENGEQTHERMQYRLRLEAFYRPSKSHCLSLKIRAANGNKWDSDWNNTGIGDKKFADDISVRNLYLDLQCYLKKVSLLQLGSIPVTAPGEIGVKRTGWIHGAGVKLDIKDVIDSIYIAVGQVDEIDESDVFQRSFDKLNYFRTIIEKKLSKTFVGYFDHSIHEENEYFRSMLTIAVNDIVSFLDSLSVEHQVTFAENHMDNFESPVIDTKHKASIIQLKKKHQRWKIRLGYSDVEEDIVDNQLPIEGFYGRNSNAHLIVEGQLSRRWGTRLRYRDGQAGRRAEIGFRIK